MSADLETLLSRANDLIVEGRVYADATSGPFAAPGSAARVAGQLAGALTDTMGQMARMLRKVQALERIEVVGTAQCKCGRQAEKVSGPYVRAADLRSALTPDADGDGGR